MRSNNDSLYGRPSNDSSRQPTFNNPWAGDSRRPSVSQGRNQRQQTRSGRPGSSYRPSRDTNGYRQSARPSRDSYGRGSRNLRTDAPRSRDRYAEPRSQRGSARPSAGGRPRADKRIDRAPTVAQMRRRQVAEQALGAVSQVIVKILPLLIVVAVVFLIGAFVYHSSLFRVTSVEVTGNVHLTQEAVAELAAVSSDSTLLRFDGEGIASRVKQNPWVADVKISRKFPDALRINVTERSITGLVMVAGAGASGATEPWAMSADGVWLAPVRNILIPATDMTQEEDTAAAETEVKSVVPSKDVDTDGDGVNDYYDADMDGDGVEEWRGIDADGDGIIDGSYAEGFKFVEEMTPEERRRYEAGESITGGSSTSSEPAETTISAIDANTAEEEALAKNPNAIDASTASGAIQIFGYTSSTAPTAGSTCGDGGILNALAVVSGLSQELSSHVVSIYAESAEQTTLMLDSGIEVAFGTATSVSEKERVVLQLLAEHEGSISYINVRVADRPTWRGL